MKRKRPVPKLRVHEGVWSSGLTMEDIKASAILECLIHHQGHRAITAKDLGISLRSLGHWLKMLQDQGHEIPVSPYKKDPHAYAGA